MRPALAIASILCASTLPAQIIAGINDSRSHGAVGDSLLSLDEAIQLANGTIQISALSAQERAQLTGISGVVGTMRIDAAITPTITMERLLSNVIGQHHSHVHIVIEGISGPGGPPVLDGGSLPVTLPIRMNDAHVDNLIIRGGQVGIEFDSTLHYHPSEYSEFGELRIEGQTAAGIRVLNPRNPSGQQAPLRLHAVHIHDTPIGIEIIDDSDFGNVDIDGEHVEIEHCDIGIKVSVDSRGGDHVLQLKRSQVVDVGHCVVFAHRSSTSNSRWRTRLVHGTYRAFDRAFDLTTNASAMSTFELHHLDVRSGIASTSYALLARPQTGHLSLLVTECTLRGPVGIAAGTGNSSMRLLNNRCEGGELSLSLTAGSGEVQWSNFTAFPIGVSAASTALSAPIRFDGCEMVRSDISDLSAGRVALTACFLGGSAISANVQNQRPQLTPWIGRSTVTPSDPPLGTFVDLSVDLHVGTAAVWLLGVDVSNPITSATPLRFYVDITSALLLPGLYQLTSRARLPIPNVRSLRGATFYFQPVQVPTQGQPQIPTVYLPVGGAIQIQ